MGVVWDCVKRWWNRLCAITVGGFHSDEMMMFCLPLSEELERTVSRFGEVFLRRVAEVY